MSFIMQFTNSLQVTPWFAGQASASLVLRSVALIPNATIEMLKRASTVRVLCGLELELSSRMIDLRAR